MIQKIGAVALLIAMPLSAQTVVQPQTPTMVNPNSNVTVVPQVVTGDILRVGTPVPVALSEPLTTKGKKLKVGQMVRLEVAQDIMVNGRLVIPARSPVEGVITEVRNKGM